MWTKLYFFTFRMPEELPMDPGPYRRRIFLLKKLDKGSVINVCYALFVDCIK
jgi:hypothetical protein